MLVLGDVIVVTGADSVLVPKVDGPVQVGRDSFVGVSDVGMLGLGDVIVVTGVE